MKFYLFIFIYLIITSNSYADTPQDDSVLNNFMYQIEYAIEDHEADVFNSFVNFDKFSKRIFTNFNLEANEEFISGFQKGFQSRFKIGQELVNNMSEIGHFTLLSYAIVGDTVFGFYRYVGADGLNYHEYVIEKNEKYEIVDVYLFSTGEYLSETMSRLVEPLLLKDDSFLSQLSDVSSKMFGEKKRYIEDVQKLPLIRKSIANGEFENAYEMYNSLDEKVRLEKACQLISLHIVGNLNDSLLLKHLQIYKETFPDDPSLDLMLIDYYFLQKKYTEALDCVTSFEKISTSDGYLQYLKSVIYYEISDTVKFLQYSKLAIEYEPWLTEPYYTLITFNLEKKDFPEVVDLMKSFEKNAGMIYTEESMKSDDLFNEFLKSLEYLDWKKESLN